MLLITTIQVNTICLTKILARAAWSVEAEAVDEFIYEDMEIQMGLLREHGTPARPWRFLPPESDLKEPLDSPKRLDLKQEKENNKRKQAKKSRKRDRRKR